MLILFVSAYGYPFFNTGVVGIVYCNGHKDRTVDIITMISMRPIAYMYLPGS